METTFGQPLRHEEYMKRAKADMVNAPPHYTHGDIECIDAIRAALGPEGFAAFCRGNILKYHWRCNHKAGLQDVEKAQWYANKLIDTMRTNPEHNNPREEEKPHQ